MFKRVGINSPKSSPGAASERTPYGVMQEFWEIKDVPRLHLWAKYIWEVCVCPHTHFPDVFGWQPHQVASAGNRLWEPLSRPTRNDSECLTSPRGCKHGLGPLF